MSLPSYVLTDVQIAEESLMVIRDLMRETKVLLGGINELQTILMTPGNVQKVELMGVIIRTLEAYSAKG